LQRLQATVSCRKGILLALPAALRLESGIVGKRWLSFGDGRAAFSDAFILVLFLSRLFYPLNIRLFNSNI
jgi:hypothetical protein